PFRTTLPLAIHPAREKAKRARKPTEIATPAAVVASEFESERERIAGSACSASRAESNASTIAVIVPNRPTAGGIRIPNTETTITQSQIVRRPDSFFRPLAVSAE